MDKIILHCDMNGFFASVELLDYPELVNVPMAVCGNPDNRHGIILAKNQLAKEYGIVTAETLQQARKKCPELQVVPPHHNKYKYYSREINKIYYRYTDMIEPFSIDESWLDVTGSRKLFGDGTQIANSIRNAVRTELGLTLSAGVSYNKFFAKMGSEYKKPDATTVITRDNYKDILWPLNIAQMFFVGEATAQKLHSRGITTIGDLACSSQNTLRTILGKAGPQLWLCANGLDDSPVSLFSEKRKIKSVGNGITFRRNLTTWNDINIAVTGISDIVSGRLRKYQLKAGGIKIDIKDSSLHVISRQKKLLTPTNLADEIQKASLELLKSCWVNNNSYNSDAPKQSSNTIKPIRLLTITGLNLCDEDSCQQISMFDSLNPDHDKSEALSKTMDSIRSRFGTGAIQYAGIIHNDLGIDLTSIKED